MTEPSLPPRDPAAGGPHDESARPETPVEAPVLSAPSPAAEPAVDEPPAEPQAADAATPPPAAPPKPRDLTLAATIVAFVIGCTAVVAGYVAINSGKLRAAAPAKSYEATRMTVSRGLGRIDGNVLAAHGVGGDVLIVAIPTDFRARDLETIAWDVTGVPANADVRLLFNSDYTPRRVHNRPLVVEDNHVLPISLVGDPDWLGRITGLALAVRAPGATVRVRGVTAKPLSLSQLLKDRAGEWFRDEPWTGTSINSVTGGAGSQTLPLPIPLMIAALIAFALVVAARRLAPGRYQRGIAPIAVLVFVIAWIALDLRWTVNLARQVVATVDRYGSKDTSERALAAEDGELVAFLDKAKALLPADPQRVVVLAEAHYFRGRASWQLLPHRVAWEPARDVAPAPGMLRTGDYVLVWRRPGALFDAANGKLRFDNGVELTASALLAERGSALFAIR